jgi:hypothetical protein
MTELQRLCWAAVDTAAGGVGDQIRTLPGPDGPSVDSVGAGHPVISNVMVSNSTIRAGPRWRAPSSTGLKFIPSAYGAYLRGSSSACGPAQGELDAAVFRAAFRSIVGRNRISLTVPDRGYKVWLRAFRDQMLHNVLGALLRQNLV